MQQRLETLERDMAQLRTQLAALTQTVSRLAEQSPGGPGALNDSARLLAGRETRFRDEQIDPAWSASATNAIQTALHQKSIEDVSRIGHLECRGRTCRLELPAEAGSAIADDLPSILHAMGPVLARAEVTRADHGDGRSATVFYFSR